MDNIEQVLEELISTIERNSFDNKATIGNVKLWAKSWRREATELKSDLLNPVIDCSHEWIGETYDSIGFALTEYCDKCDIQRDCL